MLLELCTPGKYMHNDSSLYFQVTEHKLKGEHGSGARKAPLETIGSKGSVSSVLLPQKKWCMSAAVQAVVLDLFLS